MLHAHTTPTGSIARFPWSRPAPATFAGGGRWITIHGDDEGGGVHCFVGGGGTITRGPSSLVGHNIKNLSGHPMTHHPEGHVPAGATSHPSYTEAKDKAPEKAKDDESTETLKSRGKPYAREYGADQSKGKSASDKGKGRDDTKPGKVEQSKERAEAGLETARDQVRAQQAAKTDMESKAVAPAIASTAPHTPYTFELKKWMGARIGSAADPGVVDPAAVTRFEEQIAKASPAQRTAGADALRRKILAGQVVTDQGKPLSRATMDEVVRRVDAMTSGATRQQQGDDEKARLASVAPQTDDTPSQEHYPAFIAEQQRARIDAIKGRAAELGAKARFMADIHHMSALPASGSDGKTIVSLNVPFEKTALRQAIKDRGYRFNGADKHWEKMLPTVDHARDEMHDLASKHGFALSSQSESEAARDVARYGLHTPLRIAVHRSQRATPEELSNNQWHIEHAGPTNQGVHMGVVGHVSDALRARLSRDPDAIKARDAALDAGRVERARSTKAEMSDKEAGMDTLAVDVTFSATDATTTDDGKDLILKGLLFKSGVYEDKAFEVTPSDLYESIRRFAAPAPLDLEHKPMAFGSMDLTGAFGTIDKLWSDDDGQTMQAEIRKPKWLHKVMPECRVSATFDRQTKDVIGAAWTSKPRVNDARMVVAFAESDEPDRIVSTFASDALARGPGRPRHDTPDGQDAMQRLHDIAARAGAVCTQSNAMPGANPASGMPVEFKAGGYDYSSTQLNLPADLAATVKALGKRIPDEHLAEDGREDNPHATVLYGLHTTDPTDVAPHVAGAGPVTMELGPTSISPASETGKDYDVVKAAVKSDDIHALHKRLADNLPHTSTHPLYKPHVTVAYVKKGMGQTYAGDTSLQGQKATADHVTFSSKDGKVTHLPLSGQATMSAVEFASRHEHKALQHMHDTAIAHGARCHAMPDGWGMGGRDNDDVAGQPDADEAVGMSTDLSNKCRSLRVRDGHKMETRSKAMKFMDWLMGKAQEDGVTLDQDDLAATFNSGDTDELRVELERQSRQRDTDRAEILRLRQERDEAQAVAFAERQVAVFKALPAEKEAIVLAFLRAAANDRNVTFAEGEPTNLAVLESMYEARPAHTLTRTAVPADAHILESQGTTADSSAHGDKAMMPTPDDKPMARERYEKLMKSGNISRAVLNQRERDARALGLAEREWAANRPAAIPDTTPAAHRPA